MADSEHLNIFHQGPKVWNEWRKANPEIYPDLSNEFIYPHFSRNEPRNTLMKGDITISDPENPFNFSRTNFYKSSFEFAVFPRADMRESLLYEVDMNGAGFPGSDFSDCRMRKAYCRGTDFSKATFIDCSLNNSTFIDVNFSGARIEGCNVYGVSAWGLKFDDRTVQKELFLHRDNFSRKDMKERSDNLSFVDDIALAQFVYFISHEDGFGKSLKQLNNRSVLLLGKFKDGGLELLQSVAELLRKWNYIPIIFDFEPSAHTNLIENVVTMAGMSKFVLANLEGASVPAELAKVTSNFRNPVIAYIHDEKYQQVYAMFSDVLAQDHVEFFTYTNPENLERQLMKMIKKAEDYLVKISTHQAIATQKLAEGRVRE